MRRTSFVQGMASTLNPAIDEIGNMVVSQILKNKAKQEQQQRLADLLRGGTVEQGIRPVQDSGANANGTPKELGGFGDILKPYSSEETAMKFAELGNENQQAYNLFRKLSAPKEAPKYYGIEGDTGINELTGLREKIGGIQLPTKKPRYYDIQGNTGINELTGVREQIGGIQVPSKPPIFKYDRENVELEDPITKQRTILTDASGNPVKNEGYKPIMASEKIEGGIYDKKLGKIIAQKVKYDKSGNIISKEDFAIEPDKATGEKKDIANEVVERQQKDLVDLGSYIDKELRNNIINKGTPEKPEYVVKVGNQEVNLGERKKQLEEEFKQKASTLAEITKSTLTPKARQLLASKYNQLDKKQLAPMQFQQMIKEAYKSGDITVEDYKKMSGAYFDATYGLFRGR